MNNFLEALLDLLGALFGDGNRRRKKPQRPLELPPAPPPPPVADPNEPQDSSDLSEDDTVVVTHELEPIPEEEQPEFEDNPAPPPGNEEEPASGNEPVIITQPTPPHPEHQARYMWCLDNGHGSLTAGKRSPKLADGTRFMEYAFNRDIVKRITDQLDVIGIRYFITVPEVEVGNFLEERVDRANRLSTALPKLFLSIHANAGPARSINHWTSDDVRGIETWHFHRSTKGRKMAAIFQRHLIAETGFKNRHLRSRVTGQFYVLRASKMPAALTESGFFNNRFEVLELNKDSVRQQIADAHVKAIRQIERDGL
ncbi:MAG: N-acetylmuramoyl-L-alanine amidase [Bacteroidota bacterium]